MHSKLGSLIESAGLVPLPASCVEQTEPGEDEDVQEEKEIPEPEAEEESGNKKKKPRKLQEGQGYIKKGTKGDCN